MIDRVYAFFYSLTHQTNSMDQTELLMNLPFLDHEVPLEYLLLSHLSVPLHSVRVLSLFK